MSKKEPRLDPGDLAHRLVLQVNRPASKDGFGQNVDNWVTIATVWADIAPLSGREFFNAMQVQADVTHRIRIRWRPDLVVSAGMRGLKGSRVFHFSMPPRNIEERNVYWEILAVEVIPEAT